MIPIKNTTKCTKWPVFSLLIALLNGGVFVYELSLHPQQLEIFFKVFGVVPTDLFAISSSYFNGISNLTVLPLLTAMFIHGDFFHLILNMWTMYLFAPCIEDRLGHGWFLLFFLLCGIGSSLIHAIINAGSNIPTIGASGAIAGVLGAYFVILPFSRIVVLFPIFFFPLIFEIPAFFYLLVWFISQLNSGTWALANRGPQHGGVAFWAHIGGFLLGIYLLSLFYSSRKRFP